MVNIYESHYQSPEVKIASNGILGIDPDQGIVEAFAAVIGNKDSVNDIIMPGAFDNSLKKRKPKAVWSHSWHSPVGKILDIAELPPNDPRVTPKMREAGVGGLWVKVQFNLNSQRGREAFEDVKFFGNEGSWSIGYKTTRSTYDPARKANLLHEVDLYEVSPVLHGANPLAETISIKDASGEPVACGIFDFKSCSAVEPEEKIGRVVANRNLQKLRQALELIQSILDEGGVDAAVEAKSASVKDYESRDAASFRPNEVLVYGEAKSINGVAIDIPVGCRKQAAEVLQATDHLVCAKGYLVQPPTSEDGGMVRIYTPSTKSSREAIVEVVDSLSGLSFSPEPKLASLGMGDTIETSILFSDPLNENSR